MAGALSLVATALQAQTGSVAGRIVDARSGLPVAAAEVSVAGLDLRTLSLQNGSFVLAGVAGGPRTVTVRRPGYREAAEDVTVPADGAAVLDVRFRPDGLGLDELIRAGAPQSTARRALGYAVTTVHVADVVEDAAVSSWQNLLTGRTPGLRFTRLSGNVGTGSPMTLRSVGSFGLDRAQPIVYLDGIRINSDPNSGPVIGGGRSASALDDLSPQEVESVEVLRGPAATSLYGTDAAAGVIHIITKRGVEGAPRFTVSMRRGSNYMPDPADRLGTMWACPYDNSPVNEGGSEPYAGMIVPTGSDGVACNEASELVAYNMYDEANEYIREQYFPWPTPNLYQHGVAQRYDVDVRGGSQAVDYFLSASYDDEAGFVHFNSDETFRLRANVGVAFSERLRLDVSTGYMDGFTRFASPVPGDGGEWQDMVWSNGFYLSDVTPFETRNTSNPLNPRRISDPRRGGFQEKLPSDVPDNESTREYDRFTGSATFRFQTGEWSLGEMTASLTQQAVAGIDKQWDINRNVFPLAAGEIPAHLRQYFGTNERWAAAYSENVIGTAGYERPITTNVDVGYSLTADLRISPELSLATSAGAQYHRQQLDVFQNVGAGFASPLSRTINQIAQSGIITAYSLRESKSLGFYVRQEAGFRDRLFVTGAVRGDENSTYGEHVSAQKYPSLSASWIVSDEAFWPFEAVESLRLRGAWGKAGRQPAPLANVNVFTFSTALGGLPVIRSATPGNPWIAPETTRELELGFDVSALDDRLTGSFTRYWRRTDDVIVDVDILTSFGGGSASTNAGRIDGRGWEAQLSAHVYEGGWLSADLDLAADHLDNEIKDVSGLFGPPTFGIGLPYPNQLTDDLVLDAWWDPAGNVLSSFGQRVSGLCDSGISLAPDPGALTAVNYGRLAGGPALPCQTIPNRWIYVGPAFATHIFSVAPRLRFLDDRLQVFALAQGEYGRWREANDKEFGHVTANSKVARLQDDPLWVYGFTVGDDLKRSVYDADFWRLREVGARYALPYGWVARAGADEASVSLSARNVWTLWQAQKRIYGQVISDPELGTPSLDGDANFYETPSLASVNVTLRVAF